MGYSFLSKETTRWQGLDLEPPTFRSEVQCANHYTTMPPQLLHHHHPRRRRRRYHHHHHYQKQKMIWMVNRQNSVRPPLPPRKGEKRRKNSVVNFKIRKTNKGFESVHIILFFLDDYQKDRGVWIGLNDVAMAGSYKWSDNSVPVFTKWASGQPDHRYSNQYCVTIMDDDSGHWEDINCDHQLAFICQKSA